MKIIVFAKGERGRLVLSQIIKDPQCQILALVTQPHQEDPASSELRSLAKKNTITLFNVNSPNETKWVKKFRSLKPDIFLLAGYGKILKKELLQIPNKITINLHGGQLPQMRGSSPMNWSLIRDHKHFTVNVIEVNEGIDTGPILASQTFKINTQDTIVDLHRKANTAFVKLIPKILTNIRKNNLKRKKQNETQSAYYSRRFAEDGFILWDSMRANDIHNLIRALTTPYPGAFSFYENQKIFILQSELPLNKYIGEPGRILKVESNRYLVGASDQALWISNLRAESDKTISFPLKRYTSFLTTKKAILGSLTSHHPLQMVNK